MKIELKGLGILGHPPTICNNEHTCMYNAVCKYYLTWTSTFPGSGCVSENLHSGVEFGIICNCEGSTDELKLKLDWCGRFSWSGTLWLSWETLRGWGGNCGWTSWLSLSNVLDTCSSDGYRQSINEINVTVDYELWKIVFKSKEQYQ